MSPDEHFESLNTILILSINVHWLYGNGEEGTKETQRANWSWNDEEMEKNCEDKSAVVGRNQNQNGVVFFSSLEMQRKSLLCSWALKVLDFYSTCKHSLTILCTF